jgi:hypothetical protein
MKRKFLMIHLKNSYAALILLASIATLSMQASSKKNPPAAKPAPQPKPKYVIPSKPGGPNFVKPGPGERFHPRSKR